ncbi:MAG: alpha/beta hydrolase [Saprospiraceae bacterium]|nr:alpha/beta hydrolase [Saprospiraceae bacterium]
MESPQSRPSLFAIARKWLGYLSLSFLIRWGIVLFLSYFLWKNWHEDIPVGSMVQQFASTDSRMLRIDDMDVHCRVTGKGEPILLLHDAQSSLHTWDAWTNVLSDKYKVISVDLPGFGLTGPHPRGSYSAFMYASFLDSLSKHLDLKKFHLAGNGLGAQIAWHYASESSSGKVDKLILLAAPGFETKKTSLVNLLARMPVLNRALWKVTPRSFIEIMLEDIYADDALITDSLIQRHFELLLRSGNRKAFTDRASVSDNRPPADVVEKITAPTLILWGAEDTRISPEHAYDFHRRIRGAILKIYRNTGHWPQEENPEQTAQDARAFLEGKF